jgi:CheY-like chemotaxis protein
MHDGTIAIESTLGEGTVVTVELPIVTAELPRARAALRGRRVLVVDDEPDVARLIATQLEPEGVESVLVHDGAEALARLREETFDAVTLDILMPGLSGFEVLREMRADRGLRDVPVVVVSVFSQREALAGEWVVAKPIDAGELVEALGAALVAHRTRVLVVALAGARPRLTAALAQLGLEHVWTETPEAAARASAEQRFEVALVDAALPELETVVEAIDLRGRRLGQAVIVFSGDGHAEGLAKFEPEPVPLESAAAAVLTALQG